MTKIQNVLNILILKIRTLFRNSNFGIRIFPDGDRHTFQARDDGQLRGFTLIELLMVIGLIAILTGAVLLIFNPLGQLQKSQDAKRKSDLSALQRSLESYYQDTGRYPPSTLDYRISVNAQPVNWGSAWTPYMARVPADPTPTKRYVYFTPPSALGQSYYLYTSLDRGAQDRQACNNGNACSTITGAGFPGANACGGVCNFGLTSPNVTP